MKGKKKENEQNSYKTLIPAHISGEKLLGEISPLRFYLHFCPDFVHTHCVEIGIHWQTI